MSDQEYVDIRQHRDMWKSFTRLVTWTVATIGSVLVLMAVFLL